MTHLIEFRKSCKLDVQWIDKEGGGCSAEVVKIKSGTRVEVTLFPRLVWVDGIPLETADLVCNDGAIMKEVSYGLFSFVETREVI